MSAWLKSHQALRNHPKKDHLAELLFNGTTPNDIADMAAVGLLHHLWWWALDYAPDGDLSKFTDRQIAKACGWNGEASLVVSALVASGFVDETPRVIHDWPHYGGAILTAKEQDAERKRAGRSRKSGGRPADVHGTSDVDKIRRDKKREELRASGPVDNSTVRPAARPDDRICWRCNAPISGDDVLDDKCVLSSKGLRHIDCKETP